MHRHRPGNLEEILNVKLTPTLIVLTIDYPQIRTLFHNYKVILTLEAHKNTVFAIDESPCLNDLASLEKDNTLRLWDLNSHKCIEIRIGQRNLLVQWPFLDRRLMPVS